jgi:hypothetical protein
MLSSLLLLVLFLALAPTALASSMWYVDGVNGSDKNDCKSPQTACKTIGHAISLTSSGDSIMVAVATYTENLTIAFSLKIVGTGATTTIIDGGGVATVVGIPTAPPCCTFKGDYSQRPCAGWRRHLQRRHGDDQQQQHERECSPRPVLF